MCQKQIASLFFLLITTIFLFPCFLGKVDNPVDIRNVQMYPWRYYAVDQKIKTTILFKPDFPKELTTTDKETGLSVFNFEITPKSTKKLVARISLNKMLVERAGSLTNSNYYIVFDSKQDTEELPISTELILVNKNTGEVFNPGSSFLSLKINKVNNKTVWSRTNIRLNRLLNKLESISDLNQYTLQIVGYNKSNTSATLYIKNFKIVCDDYSQVSKVHNYYNEDLIQKFTPVREYYSISLKNGKLPFWNNYILTGTELLSKDQLGYFHPLYLLIYLLFDHFTAHMLLTFICLFLCGVGSFLLAQYWQLGFVASIFTGIVYIFQPFNVTRLSYEHVLMVNATLPFLLLNYEKTIREKRLLNGYLIASATLLGLIFLSGHPQYVEYSIIFFILFLLFHFITNLPITKALAIKHILSISFIFLFGTLIGSLALIPFFPVFLSSHRIPISDFFIKAQSISLKTFLGLLYPYYGGKPDWPLTGLINRDHNYIYYRFYYYKHFVYFGFLPFLLSTLTIKSLLKNKLIIFFYSIVIFSLLISSGSQIFFLVKNLIPGFKEIQHIKFLMLFSLSVPFLAGIGFQVFVDYLSRFKKSTKQILITLVIFVTVIDLMYFSSFFVTWSDRNEYKPIPKGGGLEYLINEQKKSKEPFRVSSFAIQNATEVFRGNNISEPNTLMPYKIETLTGYSSLIEKDLFNLLAYIELLDPTQLYTEKIYSTFLNSNIPYPITNYENKIIDLLNVKYFIVPNYLNLESKKINKVFEGDCLIYENKNCLPRVFIVKDYKVIESAKNTIIKLDESDFNPLQEVILKFPPEACKFEAKSEAKQSSLVYNINFIKYEPSEIILNVSLNKSGFLVLGNNLNKNWRVEVNGKESKHYQANLVQRAVYLSEPGNYIVRFYYYPILFICGFTIASIAILVLIFLAVCLRIKRLSFV